MSNWTLQHPFLDDFEPIVKEVLRLVSHAGIEAYQREGRPPVTGAGVPRKDRKRFYRLCHRGFAAGEELLIDALLALKRQQKNYALGLKQSRKAHNKEEIQRIIEVSRVLENREWVLRSMADFLALQMFRDEKWKIRRLMHSLKPPVISEEAVQASRKYAKLSNASDLLTFSLVTDITTCIHAGHVLKVDFSDLKPVISCIELKEGSVNREISNIMEGSLDVKQA